jgi:hypothetical protein
VNRILLVFLLTAFINLINTFVRCSRLSGVRTGHLATAISLFGVVFLTASFANTLQAPLLASTVDQIIGGVSTRVPAGVTGPDMVDTRVYREALTDLNHKLRFVMLGATTGTVLGILAMPSFVTSFSNAIKAFGRTGSVFKVIPLLLLSVIRPRSGIIKFRLPSQGTWRQIATTKMTVPKTLFMWNMFYYSLWTVNVLSGLYAGVLYPEFRSTAVLMASIVGNAAIVINVMMVDPVLAGVTDAVARGKKNEAELKQVIFYLALANLAGTLLSQVIFEPVARVLQSLTRLIT